MPQESEIPGEKGRFFFSTNRIEALVDSIFAFSMTLLVLTLTLPDSATEAGAAKLSDLLGGQAHKFLNYFFSFMIAAVFWVIHHHQFRWIRRADTGLLAINAVFLMFVALMPFSTDIAGDFAGKVTAEVFFAGNVLVLGLLLTANWAYVVRRGLIDPNIGPETTAMEFKRNLVIPGISAISIVLSFFFSPWSLWLYFFTPVVLLFRPRNETAG
jgi:uncharacterized membrane protein